MSHWWRAHDEAVDDPKLGLLSDRLHRCWFNLNCLASANGGPLPPIGVVAFKLRLSEHKAAEIITALVQARLIDRRDDGSFVPHNWDARQFKSDVTDPTNATRQKRYRDRRAVTANTVTNTVTPSVTVTPPREQSTETETETETDKTSLRSDAGANGLELSGEHPAAKKPRRAPSALADDFALTETLRKFANDRGYPGQICDRLFERFCEHAKAKGLKYTDWAAAWRTWVLNQVEFDSRRPGSTGPPMSRRPDV